MSLYEHIDNITLFEQRLHALEQATPEQALVGDCIAYLKQNIAVLDDSTSPDSPFLNEFLHAVKELDISQDACFAILECFILFIREKTLLHTELETTPFEASLLHHFEHSGAWAAEDGGLVSWWYVSELPRRCRMRKALLC